jgi:N-acetylglutamate synthase-like GNAT family acetyltransferase
VSEAVVRQATPRDLPRIGQIWAATEQYESPVFPSIHQHELDTGELWVAEQNGEVLGFAGLITRGAISFLADLFV